MYNEIPLFFLRHSTKQWNDTAIDCYNINCNCEKCFIYNTYFRKYKQECMMKYCVKYFLMKLGAPKPKNNVKIC